MRQRCWYTYIMTNPRGTVLYVGMTGDLARRVAEHKQRSGDGFTARFNATRLVLWEAHATPQDAIAREKQLKGWTRERKLALIRESNELLGDLADDL
ncbi:MAG: GIY-YIG nuclease family protein [Armatimonadetes bacterium]|nr:GIY-YIG nuclease family protein [Armatimonadota bacterium]